MYSSLNMHVKFIEKEVHTCFMVLLKEKQVWNKKLKRNLKMMKCGRKKYLFYEQSFNFSRFLLINQNRIGKL